MIMPTLVLIVSAGLLIFYVQAVCQKILQRPFTHEYFQAIANVNNLEFPSVRKAIGEVGAPVEYPRHILTLRCDFLVLTYLLKNATSVYQGCTYEERLLILYFQVLFVSLFLRHWLRWREDSAVLKLTIILQYFANVVGERVNRVGFGNLSASDFLTL